jgi:hypothetical protein
MHPRLAPVWRALLALAATAAPVAAENRQEIVEIGSDLYTCLEAIILETGRALPSTARPYSVAEFHSALEGINPESLSQAGRSSYAYLVEELAPHPLYREPGVMDIGGEARASLEGYFHTTPSLGEWVHGYAERRPLLELPIELWLGDVLYGTLEPLLTKDPYVTADPDNYTNVITDVSDMDNHFPFRAFLAVGGPHWSLQFGRDELSWGAGRTGNLMITDTLDWNDYLAFTAWGRRFKLSAVYLSLENWQDTSTAAPEVRALLGHRFEVRPLDRLTVAVSETMIVETPGFEMRYLNPLMIFHNWLVNDSLSNMNLGLEIEVAPWRWLSLYAQLCADQVQSAYEQETYPSDARPNALGYLAGVDARVPLGPGYLRGGFEWVQADPWLYLIAGQPAYLAQRRVLSNYLRTMALRTLPLGYWTGPDAVVLAGTVGYKVHGSWGIGLDVLYLLKGEIGIDTPWATGAEAAALRAPSGATPERRLLLTLSGSWNPWPPVTLGIDMSWIHVADAGHLAGQTVDDLQIVPSVSVRLRGP